MCRNIGSGVWKDSSTVKSTCCSSNNQDFLHPCQYDSGQSVIPTPGNPMSSYGIYGYTHMLHTHTNTHTNAHIHTHTYNKYILKNEKTVLVLF